MLGGGTFVTQNKVLPGSYINFVSAQRTTSNLSDRGVVAIGLPLKWGKDDKVITVTGEDLRKNCLKTFGFEYTSDEAKPLREIFKNASTAYIYKLMKNGVKATNTIAEALYKGSVGAKLSTEILAGTESGTFDVSIYYDNTVVFEENVKTLDELKADNNGWVKWTLATLEAKAKEALAGSSLDGDDVTATEHTNFLKAIEGYSYNAVAYVGTENTLKELYITQCKDDRENAGIKYQVVVYDKKADYEGVVNVKNSADLVYWTLGAIAGCPINASNTNKVYDGEYDVNTNYTRAELESAIKAGEFTFHAVGDDVRVLVDINSLTTVTEAKNEDFKNNQTIRVIDQIATDIAYLFNSKYLGKIPNDNAGRVSLWNDIVTHHNTLQDIRAIEDFSSKDITVEQGESKTSVVVNDLVTITNCMEKLYMTVVCA